MNYAQIIADIESVIEGRASDSALERAIDGTSLKFATLDQLISWREKFLILQQAERGDGAAVPRTVLLRFREGK